jgi:hypothetical protein
MVSQSEVRRHGARMAAKPPCVNDETWIDHRIRSKQEPGRPGDAGKVWDIRNREFLEQSSPMNWFPCFPVLGRERCFSRLFVICCLI